MFLFLLLLELLVLLGLLGGQLVLLLLVFLVLCGVSGGGCGVLVGLQVAGVLRGFRVLLSELFVVAFQDYLS